MRTVVLVAALVAIGCGGNVDERSVGTGNPEWPHGGGVSGSDATEATGGVGGAGGEASSEGLPVCPEHHHEFSGSCVCDEGLILDQGEPCPDTFTLTASGRCWCPL